MYPVDNNFGNMSDPSSDGNNAYDPSYVFPTYDSAPIIYDSSHLPMAPSTNQELEIPPLPNNHDNAVNDPQYSSIPTLYEGGVYPPREENHALTDVVNNSSATQVEGGYMVDNPMNRQLRGKRPFDAVNDQPQNLLNNPQYHQPKYQASERLSRSPNLEGHNMNNAVFDNTGNGAMYSPNNQFGEMNQFSYGAIANFGEASHEEKLQLMIRGTLPGRENHVISKPSAIWNGHVEKGHSLFGFDNCNTAAATTTTTTNNLSAVPSPNGNPYSDIWNMYRTTMNMDGNGGGRSSTISRKGKEPMIPDSHQNADFPAENNPPLGLPEEMNSQIEPDQPPLITLPPQEENGDYVDPNPFVGEDAPSNLFEDIGFSFGKDKW